MEPEKAHAGRVGFSIPTGKIPGPGAEAVEVSAFYSEGPVGGFILELSRIWT
jgi:hypothetical protein